MTSLNLFIQGLQLKPPILGHDLSWKLQQKAAEIFWFQLLKYKQFYIMLNLMSLSLNWTKQKIRRY